METKIVVRQGKDFINIFYEIPEGLRYDYNVEEAVLLQMGKFPEGLWDHFGGQEYVASLEITLYVEGQPFDTWLVTNSPYFGRFYEKLLAPGEYSYKIVEKVYKRKPGTRQTEQEVNEISESFTI